MLHLNFYPFPEIVTERLLLRQLISSDDNEIFIMRSDPRILKYLDMPPAKDIEAARNFITRINNNVKNNESIYWGICLKDNPRLIGTICLWNISNENFSADSGYVLMNEHQGKGYMVEALKKVLLYGFENMGLKTIHADVDPNNIPSINLLEKYNFTQAKKAENTVIYSLEKTKFQS